MERNAIIVPPKQREQSFAGPFPALNGKGAGIK
jgi:hypothetical protein